MRSQTLLEEIEEFLAEQGQELSETAFGIKAINDGKFVKELREGRRVWPETADKVRTFMADDRARRGVPSPRPADAAA